MEGEKLNIVITLDIESGGKITGLANILLNGNHLGRAEMSCDEEDLNPSGISGIIDKLGIDGILNHHAQKLKNFGS